MDVGLVIPEVDENKCTRCGLCVEACACHAVEMGPRGPVFTRPEVCASSQACAEGSDCFCLCEEVCPTGAITIPFEIVMDEEKE